MDLHIATIQYWIYSCRVSVMWVWKKWAIEDEFNIKCIKASCSPIAGNVFVSVRPFGLRDVEINIWHSTHLPFLYSKSNDVPTLEITNPHHDAMKVFIELYSEFLLIITSIWVLTLDRKKGSVFCAPVIVIGDSIVYFSCLKDYHLEKNWRIGYPMSTADTICMSRKDL